MSNQGDVQAAVRAISGTSLEFNGDWHALFTWDGIATGTFNERMLDWINFTLGTSFASLPQAQQAFAEARGFNNWSSMEGIFMSHALTPVYVSGRWYLPDSRETVMSAGSAFGAANTQRLSPGIIDRTVTISELGCFVTTADAGQNIQLGIYRSSATTAYPTTLVGNTGSITLTGTGSKTAALSGGNVTLTPGLYWFSTNNTGTAVVCVRGATGQTYGGIAIGSTTLGNIIGNAVGLGFLTTPETFGTWTPNITSNTFTEATGSNRALMAFKVA